MSKRYPGGIITKSPATPTGPYENGTAPGIWTLEQQMQFAQQGIWPTAGLTPPYIEDVFSTYLYTGNDTTQTITNGIDLATKGGIVWIKPRNQVQDHVIFDTVGGITKSLASNNTSAQYTATGGTEGLVSFNTTGFTTRLYQNSTGINNSGCNLASWTFRKQPKFFDIQTWTGNGAARTISHNLGSVPGCMIVKRTDAAGYNWFVYHVSLGNSSGIVLNDTNGSSGYGTALWNSTTPTSTVFSLGTNSNVNASGGTYVAYLFAHNAGGFGLTGTDNVISCGSYTSNGSTISVNLGWEPQWILIKRTSNTGNWNVTDNMRGMTAATANASAPLFPNLSDAELDASSTNGPAINATGFTVPYSSSAFNYPSGETYIYIAIRRGPMRVPTDATKVYTMALINPSSANNTNFVTSGFPVDLWTTITATDPFADPFLWMPRLTTLSLSSASTNAESGNPYTNMKFDGNTGIVNRTGATGSTSLTPNWMFQRAPSFFDVVCYTGTGANTTVTHNLGAVPELLIVKVRTGSSGESWTVWNKTIAASNAASTLWLNSTSSVNLLSNRFNSTAPTSSVFSVGNDGATNGSAWTYVAYLFATCAGVSKVGSYTGTGATQTIDCGLTAGARFVMIKRTDSTGGWYVWDTTRGMVSGTDPSKLWNTSAAQVNANSVFTIATGFQIVSTAAEINASGGTYIFLAIA